MTRDEFDAWLSDVHTGCFPGIAAWLRKMDTSEREAVMGEWFGILRFYPPADCAQASRDLWEGKSKPKGFGIHPIIIKRMLRAKKFAAEHAAAEQKQWNSPVDGEPTFACLECRDEGLIECFHPKTVAEMRRTPDAKVVRYTTSRRCTCAAGQQYKMLPEVNDFDVRSTYRDSGGRLCWQ